jgi:hypothetical protein
VNFNVNFNVYIAFVGENKEDFGHQDSFTRVLRMQSAATLYRWNQPML